MVEALVIIAWRNDVGAYLFDSIPEGIEIDGQDLMNLYNLHRFRDTRANFQFIQSQDLRIASFYSGGYNNPYMGKPNYAVAVVLSPGENPDDYEKPLRILCNNLLIHLDDDDFDYYFQQMYELVRQGRLDELKIERGSAPEPQEPDADLNPISSDDDELFDDLLETVSEEIPDDLKFDEDAFRRSLQEQDEDDPFGSGADPFSGGSNTSSGTDDDEDSLFDEAFQNESDSSAFSGDPFAKLDSPAVPSAAKATKKASIDGSALLSELQRLKERLPKKPADGTPQKQVQYLEKKVGTLEKMLGVLSKIAQQLQQKDQEIMEKDEIIGKLLMLLS